MAVKNYPRTIVIRAKEGEAQSWARSAGESGQKVSSWIRATLNARSGYAGEATESLPAPDPMPEAAPESDREATEVETTLVEDVPTSTLASPSVGDDLDLDAYLALALSDVVKFESED